MKKNDNDDDDDDGDDDGDDDADSGGAWRRLESGTKPIPPCAGVGTPNPMRP